MAHESYDTLKLVRRTLMPTAASVIGGLFFAITIIVLHMLAISLQFGTVLPNAPESDVGFAYTNYFIGPFLHITNSRPFSLLVAALVWGTFGWLLVSVVQYLVRAIKEWHEATTNVEITSTQVIPHPGRNEHITKLFWRLGSLVTFMVFIFMALPIMYYLFAVDQQLFANPSIGRAVLSISVEIVVWGLLFHCLVVFLRFYFFRTRVFGELLY